MHESKPFFGVQFHPEVSPGPTDTEVCQPDDVCYMLEKKNQRRLWVKTQENKIIGAQYSQGLPLGIMHFVLNSPMKIMK